MPGCDCVSHDRVNREEALPILARLAEQARQTRSQSVQYVLLRASCEIAELIVQSEASSERSTA